MIEQGPEGITPVVLTTLDENACLTYTHANTFTQSGRIVLPVSTELEDGKVLIVYYYNTRECPEYFIEGANYTPQEQT